jgi:hypothetical protein
MPRIESLILANHVEASGGLLYVSGGGWMEYVRPAPTSDERLQLSHIGIGLTLLVPAGSGGSACPLTIRLEDAAGEELARTAARLDLQDRAPPGRAQRAVLTFSMNVVFPDLGDYRVVAEIGEGAAERRSVVFRVRDPPGR